jgi:hypothetical protein
MDMEMDILRSNMIVKKSSNNIMTFYQKSKMENTNIFYYTKNKKDSSKHVILYQKNTEKEFINNLKLLGNMLQDISIYTDNDNLKKKIHENMCVYNCDVRNKFRLIFSMGTIMNLKRRNRIEVDDVLKEIIEIVDKITLNNKEFINLLEKVLSNDYPISKNMKKYIIHFYKKYKNEFNDDYKHCFKNIVYTMLNEDTCKDLEKLENLMLSFTDVSLNYFKIVLDWVYLYELENSKENILIYYIEENHLRHLKKYMKYNGYTLNTSTEDFKTSCTIQ